MAATKEVFSRNCNYDCDYFDIENEDVNDSYDAGDTNGDEHDGDVSAGCDNYEGNVIIIKHNEPAMRDPSVCPRSSYDFKPIKVTAKTIAQF